MKNMKEIMRLATVLMTRQKKQSKLALVSILISISTLSALFALTDINNPILIENRIWLSVISLLVLFISVATIVIAMHNLVLHRTHQLGIMKAIGATNNKIILLVLSESALIGFIGGLGGILVSSIFLLFFTAFLGFQYQNILPQISIITSIATIFLGMSIGIIAGWLSTRKVLTEQPARIIRRV